MDDAPEGSGSDPGNPDPDEEMPNQAAMANWDAVVADMEATAAEYEDEGWETLQIHPGDVAVLDGEDGRGPGFDVVVPDPEFEALAEIFESGTDVEETAVFRASVESMTYLVLVLQHADGTAVLVPAYYRVGDPGVEAAFRRAEATGEFRTRLRTLTHDQIVVSHEDPSLFAPAEAGDGD